MLSVAALLDRGHGAVGIEMACTGTVSQLAHRVLRLVRLFVFFVRARSEIVGVATRAIRLVGWLRPGCRLRVALVTIETTNARSVISGITGRRMGEVDGSPACRAVAGIALQGRAEVVSGFTGCTDAIVAG